MFASGQQVIDVPVSAAQARLARLLYGGWLSEASDDTYRRSADDLMRVGPLGESPGTSRLVRVQFTDPAYRGDEMRIGLRWEAVGMTGPMFPALDADISLCGDGERTQVSLTGTYRPPLGSFGAGLDRLVLHKIATATITVFLTRLCAALNESVVDRPDRPATDDDRVTVDRDTLGRA
jgi:hypothetical protein